MPHSYTWTPESRPTNQFSTVRIRTWDNKPVPEASYTITPPSVILNVPTQNRYTVTVRTNGDTETAHLDIPKAQNSTSLEERVRSLVANIESGTGGLNEDGTLPASAIEPLDTRYTRKGHEVFNVRDYGVKGDGTTNDVVAIEALARTVSQAGGGTLLFPRGTYAVNRAIYCFSNIDYVGDNAIIKNTNTTGLQSTLGAFMPGGIYARNLKTDMGTDTFPYSNISDVPEGSTSITVSTAGWSSAVAVGDFVTVRSVAHQVIGQGVFPFQMYITKVLSVQGNTIELVDAAPYTITGAMVHHLKGSPDSGPTDGAGRRAYMVENCSVTNFGIDAHYPFWGGGAYHFRASRLRPANRKRFSSFITLNAMVKFEFSDCLADWYYQFCELKLGSSDGTVRDCVGTWGPGTAYGTPVNFGEAAHNIKFTQNTINIPTTYNHGTAPIVDIAFSRGIRVVDNTINVMGKCDNIVSASGSSTAWSNSTDFTISDNRISSSALANRYISVGSSTNVHPPARFIIKDNIMTGVSNPTVGQWLIIGGGVDYIVKDNIAPPSLTSSVGPNVRGRMDSNHISTAYTSHTTTPVAMAGYLGTSPTSKSIGVLPMRGAVSHIRVEVLTAYNGTTTNTLNIGYSSLATAFGVGIDVSTTGVRYITPGQTGAGTRLGVREVTANRDVLVSFTGTGATAGQVLVTVYYEPMLMPAS